MKRWLCLFVVAGFVAGCSNSASIKTHSDSTSAIPRSSKPYRPGVSDDAATIASHIPGCSGVRDESVGNGGPALTSSASCTLTGHVVIVDVWADSSSAVITPQLANGTHYTYARGSTWNAFVGDQGVDAANTTLQLQFTNQADKLLQQANDPPVHPSSATQQQLAATVAGALGGAVATV